MIKLSDKLIDTFCSVFGEKYRGVLTPNTSMDDISEWDSLNFVNLVMALEQAFEIEFTEDEAAQLFQLGHIQKIIDNIVLNIPHDDVAHAICSVSKLKNSSEEKFNVVIISGSSTREGLILNKDAEKLLKYKFNDNDISFHNISVSGLVAAETLQLLDVSAGKWNGVVLFGTSPIIWGGCGQSEFNRSLFYRRFPFKSEKMEAILKKHGFFFSTNELPVLTDLDLMVERYLRNKSMETMEYNQYLYPTLAPWTENRFNDEEYILRFYNNSIKNYNESIKINTEFYEEIYQWCMTHNIALGLVELTIHSATLKYLENLGKIYSRYLEFIKAFVEDRKILYINALNEAGINDQCYRDPAHIFQRKEEYTDAIFDKINIFIK